MKKQKANSHEGITSSEMGKQNVQAKEVCCSKVRAVGAARFLVLTRPKFKFKFLIVDSRC